MSVYTRKGDKGETNLFSGKKISKDCLNIEAIGGIDELNSYLGIVVSHSEDEKLKKTLIDIQKDLLAIGSILGGSSLRFSVSKTRKLERLIDEIEKELPELKCFIIPGGCKIASHLHFARTLCRRAERAVVAFSKEEKVKPQILSYLNRLSDLLFVLARKENWKLGVGEKEWGSKKGLK